MAGNVEFQFPPVRLLFYEEDGECVAHALELDLVGTGSDREAAMADLEGAIKAQLTHLLENDAIASFYHPAPKKFFDKWEPLEFNGSRQSH